MKKFRPITLIILASVLVTVAVNFVELSGRTDAKRLRESDRNVPVREVVFPETGNESEDGGQAGSEQIGTITNAAPTYVGRDACGECHKENYEAHLKHGHASTFFAMDQTNLSQLFDGQTFDGGEGFGVYSYRRDDGGKLTAILPDGDKSESFPIQFVLGSGHNAQTFLSLGVDANGNTQGIEHRVSCYVDDRLGITVGQENASPDAEIEKFGSPVRGEVLERCIYCHTTTSKVENGHVVDLTSHVNCEKCHGPGSEHVRLARDNPTPPPYSVGMENWDQESEIQLCGDCHRLPRSISLRELREYPNMLVRFQPVGMLRSKCHLESEKGLRCSTCHNPHQSNHASGARETQVKNCINCHDEAHEDHTLCPVSPTDNCIHCHMPLVEQKQGIKFHDHWIRVHER